MLSTVPVGAPFLANPTDNNFGFFEIESAIAMDGHGNFVVAWVNGAAGPGVGQGYDIFAQRFNAAGNPLGAAILVNSGVAGDQRDPSVAMNANGDFVVAWHTGLTNNVQGDIYARQFNAAGMPKGTDIRVSELTRLQGSADVAMDANGDFVVAWAGLNSSVFVRRFNSVGEAQGGEFKVGVQNPNAIQVDPTVAMDADGRFVVCWSSAGVIYGQRYDAAGAAQVPVIQIGATSPNATSQPDVAMNASGEFVVTWTQGPFGQPSEIFAERFAASGVPEGSGFKVDQALGTEGSSGRSRVAIAPSGAFLITWQFGSAVRPSIYARGYDAGGVPVDNPFVVAVESQFYPVTVPSVAVDAAGESVIVWRVSRDFGLSALMYGQRFTNAPNQDGISVAPTALIPSEGNSGTTNLVYTVSLAAAAAQPLAVLYETVDGSASAADSDYIAISGTLTFEPGETTKLLTVEVSGDLKPEADEYFRLNLSTTSLDDLPDAVATVTIRNDDQQSFVYGRQLFYNQSAFDGDDATINSADDGAIAPDKSAYLPGDGLATFANVSSYSRGINGIIVDLLGGVDHANISASDFVFKIGNNNAPGTWTELTATPTISVRTGAGLSGSDRVEITWAANTITNTWLEVQVLPTLQTGLTAADVFYWGSRIGDVGAATPAGNFLTSAADVTSVRYQFAAEVPITTAGDFNRDGSVTAADATLAVSNIGTIVRLHLGEPPVATIAVDTTAVAVGLVASAGFQAHPLVSTTTTCDPPTPVAKSEVNVGSVARAQTAAWEITATDGIALQDNLDAGDLDDDLVSSVALAWSAG